MTGEFYISSRATIDGFHRIHMAGCPFLPSGSERNYLGKHNSIPEVLRFGRHYCRNTATCLFCMKPIINSDRIAAASVEPEVESIGRSGRVKSLFEAMICNIN